MGDSVLRFQLSIICIQQDPNLTCSQQLPIGYGWLICFKPSRSWDHLVIWFWLLVYTKGYFFALFCKSDEMHTYLGGYWLFLSELCIRRNRPSMLKSYWQNPWKFGRYFYHTWWKDGVDKDGGWKGGGWRQAASTVETFLEVSVAGEER